MTDARKELRGDEYNKRIIDLSGTLTSDQEVILPLKDGSDWLVRNNTKGGHTIIVKGASGGGLRIPPSSVKAVFTDGTNFYG